MEAMVEVLEQELEGAFEVKDRKSLHRYVLLLTENVVKKENYERQQLEMRSDIRNLAELTRQGFARMDERFEAMQIQMDLRFDAVDKRFEAMQIQMNLRFDAVDKRFEAINKRFETIQSSMDKRFEDMQSSMDKRFEDMQSSMDKRFEDMQSSMNKRFDGIDKKFNMMFTFMNIGMGIIILITILAKFLM